VIVLEWQQRNKKSRGKGGEKRGEGREATPTIVAGGAGPGLCFGHRCC